MDHHQLAVYSNSWIINYIYSVSDKIRNKVIDQTRFEERCIKKVARYLSAGDTNISNKRFIASMIRKEAHDYVSWCKKEAYELLADLTFEDEDGNVTEYEPPDMLGNVEAEVIAREMTVLLGKDGRRKLILEAWSYGNTNDLLISVALGRTLGGNKESHRKFIQRFRKECREQLSAII